MTITSIPHPPIVSREDWLVQRKKLLAEEKELTQHKDRVNAQRRRLPMVKVEKDYHFDGPGGKRSLSDLFEGRPQLIVYHFMYDPAWEKGCTGCTGFIDALGDLSMLKARNTTFAVISRAPLAKLKAYQAERGWDIPWFSSFESDFNYDFHVTLDKNLAPVESNYQTQAELEAKKGKDHLPEGETHGISVFFQLEGEPFHGYSAFARGVESRTNAYELLDITPYGRQEAFEDSPQGWPQAPAQ